VEIFDVTPDPIHQAETFSNIFEQFSGSILRVYLKSSDDIIRGVLHSRDEQFIALNPVSLNRTPLASQCYIVSKTVRIIPVSNIKEIILESCSN
jgi:hypothetical protein